jgi:hypothetical protein
VNITFDGQGNLNSTLNVQNKTYTFTGTYQCWNTTVQFSFFNTTHNYGFIGNLEGGNTIIRGKMRLLMSESNINGTFFMTKY